MSYYPVSTHADDVRAANRLTAMQAHLLNDLSGYDDDEVTTFEVSRTARSLINRGLAAVTTTGLHITGAGYDVLCAFN